MASNLLSQLREADAIDKLDEVLEEIPRTRKDLGYPPLVTPMSQMIGSQSVSNVLFGKYEMISGQVKEYVYGMYGRPPSVIDPEIAKTVLKDYKKGSPVIHERPANLLDPEMEKAKSEIADITDNIDDVLIYALYPTTGLKFLRIKHGLDQMPEEMKPGFDSEPVAIIPQPRDQYPPKSQLTKTFNVFVENEYFKVEVDPADVHPGQIVPMVNQSEGINQEKIAPDFKEPSSKDSVTNNGESLVSPMPGILLRYLVEEGDEVKVGEPVAILEAMKMENTLPSPATGTVQKLQVTEGATVVKGDVLIVLS
jgi:pyruvate carboxylase subunit B